MPRMLWSDEPINGWDHSEIETCRIWLTSISYENFCALQLQIQNNVNHKLYRESIKQNNTNFVEQSHF